MSNGWGLDYWAELPPALSNEETCNLIREGSEESLQKAVVGNLRLIRSVVTKRIFNLERRDAAMSSKEDLEQQCVLALMRCVRNFNPDLGIQFSSFAVPSILNQLGMEYRYQQHRPVLVSFEIKVKGTSKQDDSNVTLGDSIADPNFADDKIESFLDVSHITDKILPILSKYERDLFVQHYFQDIPMKDLAFMHSANFSSMARTLRGIKAKVARLYSSGISQEDIDLRGVRLRQDVVEQYRVRKAMVKKLGVQFLRECFLSSLTEEQRVVFVSGFLHFYGQPTSYIALEAGISVQKAKKELQNLSEMLESEEVASLRRSFLPSNMLKDGHKRKLRQTVCFLNRHGGKAFLWKYFVPTLEAQQKRVFMARFLNYDGVETDAQIACRLGIEKDDFCEHLRRIAQKIQSTNFELLNELIDNTKTSVDKKISVDFGLVEKRKQIVEEFGGVIFLKKYFLPTLTGCQKKIFEDFYLMPKYADMGEYAKMFEISYDKLLALDSQILERLSAADLSATQRNVDLANLILSLQAVNKARNSKVLEKYGGEQFLMSCFVPNLSERERIVFVDYFVRACSYYEIIVHLGEKFENYLAVVDMADNISKKLSRFAKHKEEFLSSVQEFYKHNPRKKTILQPSELAQRIDKNAKFLERYGKRKDLVEKFMPSLSPKDQQTFIGCYIGALQEDEVAGRFGMTDFDVADSQIRIANKLEAYRPNKLK